MNKFLKIIIFLTLIISLGLILLTNLFSLNTQEIVDDIELNLAIEWKNLQHYSETVLSEVKKGNLNFSNYSYATLLYQGNQLTSWNSSEFERSDFKSNDKENIYVSKSEKGLLLYVTKKFEVDSNTFDLILSSPIIRVYPFNNQYLNTELNPSIIPNGVEVSETKRDARFVPITLNEEVVFYISPPYQTVFKPYVLRFIQVFTVLFISFLGASLFLTSYNLAKTNKPKLGFFVLTGGILVTRLLMLLFNFPNTFLHTDLFRSSIFISSSVNSSLGDLLLNNLCLNMAVFYVALNRERFISWIEKTFNKFYKKLLRVLLISFGYGILFAHFKLVFNLLSNAQIPLDVFSNIEFTYLSVAAYLSMLSFGISYFFINDLIFKIILTKSNFLQFLQSIIWSSVLLLSICWLLDQNIIIILVAQSIYGFLLFQYKLPTRLSRMKFGTFLYGLLGIFLLAAISATAVYSSHEYKELNRKEKLATKLLIDRDVEGEYLLNQVLENVEADVLINSLLVNPQSPKQQILDRIERYFIAGYFDNYNVKIALFDKDGKILTPTNVALNFDSLKLKYEQLHVETDFQNIYFQNNDIDIGQKKYACFLTFERYERKTGHVLLELSLKKQISKSVYPELLLERQFAGKNEFDYAIYNQNELLYNIGSFNYKADFMQEWFDESKIYRIGLEKNGIHHFAIKGIDKTIIISSTVYSSWAILSNFSFYFIITLLAAIFISIINSLSSSEEEKSISFSTKILIYIGCAFAIPIAFVGFAVINTINTSYTSEIEKSYEKKTIAIGEGLVGILERYLSHNENKESLTNEISKISRTSRADINLYNTQGKLMVTSQPKMFDSGLLTSQVNADGFNQILIGKKDNIILDESIGKLDYKSSYIAIRSFEDGALLGIMSSPFFGSKNHLNRQKAEVFNNILNITTLIFIFSVWFTYLAVRRLTSPIILIASKLKNTELEETNQPLEWKSNDEIGLLIQEYNKMVKKLEVSKVELAKNEKEAAWREMAKQVAHEIKNPLTPMKLTLQHLDRVMEKDDIRRKPLITLLSQVDTLDEIVTSFSHFAKMPDPENVVFDIKEELEKIVNLHPEKNIIFKNNAHNCNVLADRKLFGRIFNNIILNGFQAMSDIGNPEMNIDLSIKSKQVQISFSDRGSGISDEIADRVFVPNFSTKDSGSGIGLAVAKRGIEHAGGKIYFESKEGKGTTFFIEIPVIIN